MKDETEVMIGLKEIWRYVANEYESFLSCISACIQEAPKFFFLQSLTTLICTGSLYVHLFSTFLLYMCLYGWPHKDIQK